MKTSQFILENRKAIEIAILNELVEYSSSIENTDKLSLYINNNDSMCCLEFGTAYSQDTDKLIIYTSGEIMPDSDEKEIWGYEALGGRITELVEKALEFLYGCETQAEDERRAADVYAAYIKSLE